MHDINRDGDPKKELKKNDRLKKTNHCKTKEKRPLGPVVIGQAEGQTRESTDLTVLQRQHNKYLNLGVISPNDCQASTTAPRSSGSTKRNSLPNPLTLARPAHVREDHRFRGDPERRPRKHVPSRAKTVILISAGGQGDGSGGRERSPCSAVPGSSLRGAGFPGETGRELVAGGPADTRCPPQTERRRPDEGLGASEKEKGGARTADGESETQTFPLPFQLL